MDFQNRVGSKHRGGGVASAQESNVDRRERLRRLAMETIDIKKDPYFMRNHLGQGECKLCLTLHSNEGSYLAHTQGKKHQTNLARRAAKEARDNQYMNQPAVGPAKPVVQKKTIIKIGRPGYRVTKIRDPNTQQLGMLFQIQYPQIANDVKPLHRFMSAYEQHIEQPNKAYQYLVIAAEPYESVAFKIQSKEIDRAPGKFWTHWDPDAKQFSLQFVFKQTAALFSGMQESNAAAHTDTPMVDARS